MCAYKIQYGNVSLIVNVFNNEKNRLSEIEASFFGLLSVWKCDLFINATRET